MQATTIKLENPLLQEVKKILPKDESISSFVRSLLEQELQRRKMIHSAEEYVRFLEDRPEEKKWLEDWESADLISPIHPKNKKRAKV